MNEDHSNGFGRKSLVPPVMERNIGLYVSPKMLAEHLKTVRRLISDESAFKKRFSEVDCDALVESLFGNETRIKISEALDNLRKNADTLEKKLLIRTLALYSFDAVSPEQTRRVNPKQLYDDLHILETELLPQPRMSGPSTFLVYTLAVDDIGLVRLHIFPPSNDKPTQFLDDTMIHQHPMDSSSIILAGEIVNKHHTVISSPTPNSNGLALYEISTVRRPNGEIDRTYQRRSYVDEAEVIAEHRYKAGDYYHLPGVAKPDFSKRTGMSLSPDMLQTFHTTKSHGFAATLFTQRKTPNLSNDLTIQPESWHGEHNTRPHTATILNPDDCYTLLVKADAEIRRALSGVDRVNCLYLVQVTKECIDAHLSR